MSETPERLGALEESNRILSDAYRRLAQELTTLRAQVNEALWRLGIGGQKYKVCDECEQGKHEFCGGNGCICLHSPPTGAQSAWRASRKLPATDIEAKEWLG